MVHDFKKFFQFILEAYFLSNHHIFFFVVFITYETSFQKLRIISLTIKRVKGVASSNFLRLPFAEIAALKRGNSDYELCKIKWNGGDKALFDRAARRATWRWIKQQAHQDYAAGVYSRLVSIRRRLKATFSHDDSLLRYSPDFFTLERSREGSCACMRRRTERELFRHKETVYSSRSFCQLSFSSGRIV